MFYFRAIFICILSVFLAQASLAKGKSKKQDRSLELSTESYVANIEGFYENFINADFIESEFAIMNDANSDGWQINKAVYLVEMDISVVGSPDKWPENFDKLYQGIIQLTPASNLVRDMPFKHRTTCDVKRAENPEEGTSVYHHSIQFNVHVEYGLNNHGNKYAALDCLRRYFR